LNIIRPKNTIIKKQVKMAYTNKIMFDVGCHSFTIFLFYNIIVIVILQQTCKAEV
jgi:hypothetical protein